jgi:hypothetical protein
MKLISAATLACALALVSAPTLARAQAYSFAGTSWGDNIATTKTHITDAGFEFIKLDDDGDLSFDGTVRDFSSRVYAIFTPKQELVKVTVQITTPDDDAISTYKAMVSTLTKKYGDPTGELNQVKPPYTAGQTLEAIKDGKGTMATLWGSDAKGYMAVEVTQRLNVRVSYESPDWSAESDRRSGTTSSGSTKPAAASPF